MTKNRFQTWEAYRKRGGRLGNEAYRMVTLHVGNRGNHEMRRPTRAQAQGIARDAGLKISDLTIRTYATLREDQTRTLAGLNEELRLECDQLVLDDALAMTGKRVAQQILERAYPHIFRIRK